MGRVFYRDYFLVSDLSDMQRSCRVLGICHDSGTMDLSVKRTFWTESVKRTFWTCEMQSPDEVIALIVHVDFAAHTQKFHGHLNLTDLQNRV